MFGVNLKVFIRVLILSDLKRSCSPPVSTMPPLMGHQDHDLSKGVMKGQPPNIAMGTLTMYVCDLHFNVKLLKGMHTVF